MTYLGCVVVALLLVANLVGNYLLYRDIKHTRAIVEKYLAMGSKLPKVGHHD